MGDVKGFMTHGRKNFGKEPIENRVKHFHEFLIPLSEEEMQTQGARCMDCGIPFCHTGCPLGNIIPDWNDLVFRGNWREALDRLHATNNFPEFTGRVCPAPCEAACVLGINEDPVAIKSIEVSIADRGWDEGWIVPEPPRERSGKSVAVVGSGPAGLAAAQQLNRAGHTVTVYERSDRPGGLLMYGIPDFKLDKNNVKRRVEQMEAEGVTFKCSVDIGKDVTLQQLRDENDAVLLACGSTQARDLPIPGRELKGVYQAMHFLPQQNKRNQGDEVPADISVTAEGKRVVVIGGGDTGSDCVGTSNRQGCSYLAQFEILPQPPDLGSYPRAHERPENSPWPNWPLILRTSTSHEEGADRYWLINTKEFRGNENGELTGLTTVEVEWEPKEGGGFNLIEKPETKKEWPCELVLLAMGFVGPMKYVLDGVDVELDERPNGTWTVKCDANYATSVEGVFACGDMRRGQSLVVWALHEGREAARSVDAWLTGVPHLPSTNAADFIPV